MGFGGKGSHTNVQISAEPGIKPVTLWLQNSDLKLPVVPTLLHVKIYFWGLCLQVITDYVYDLLEAQGKLKKLYLPVRIRN